MNTTAKFRSNEYVEVTRGKDKGRIGKVLGRTWSELYDEYAYCLEMNDDKRTWKIEPRLKKVESEVGA